MLLNYEMYYLAMSSLKFPQQQAKLKEWKLANVSIFKLVLVKFEQMFLQHLKNGRKRLN